MANERGGGMEVLWQHARRSDQRLTEITLYQKKILKEENKEKQEK